MARANDKIVVDGFDDQVQGVACTFPSQTGGVKPMGVARIRVTPHRLPPGRPIKILGELKDGERVFDEHRSLVFKTLQVVRFFDSEPQCVFNVSTAIGYRGQPQNRSARYRSWNGRYHSLDDLCKPCLICRYTQI